MTNLSKNIIKNINFYIILISFLLVCYLIWLVTNDFNKGFNLADESYYLNLYQEPTSENLTLSYFHYIGSMLFTIAKKNIIILRYLGYLILFLSSILCCYSIIKVDLLKKKGILFNYLLFVIAIISSNNYYGIYIFTPSYNLFNISLISIFVSLVSLRFYYFKKDNLILNFFLSLFFFILAINKFSTAFLIFILFVIIFFKNISKKLIVHFITFNLLAILIFIYLDYDKINLLINYLFIYDDNFIIFKHHSLLQLFDSFSDLYSRLVNYNLKYYFVILLILSILLKSNLNVFIIFFIFFEFLIYKKNGGGLSLSTVFLFFYNLVLFLIFRKNIYLKNSIYLFYAYFLCIAFWFGSNNEINRYINISSSFLYIVYYLLLVNNLKTNQEKKNVLICFIFFILVFINLYKVTHHHKKIDYSFREHVNKNNVMLKAKYNSKSLKGLQVRKEFQLFLQNYTQILLKNHWKEGDYIVDATLKNPGLIYLANAKYLFKGWYIHNPDLLKIALNSLDRKIKPWLILSNNNKLQKIVMNHFYNFEDRYNLIGIIEDPVNSRKYKIYKPN